jgi:hypothetical protein
MIRRRCFGPFFFSKERVLGFVWHLGRNATVIDRVYEWGAFRVCGGAVAHRSPKDCSRGLVGLVTSHLHWWKACVLRITASTFASAAVSALASPCQLNYSCTSYFSVFSPSMLTERKSRPDRDARQSPFTVVLFASQYLVCISPLFAVFSVPPFISVETSLFVRSHVSYIRPCLGCRFSGSSESPSLSLP